MSLQILLLSMHTRSKVHLPPPRRVHSAHAVQWVRQHIQALGFSIAVRFSTTSLPVLRAADEIARPSHLFWRYIFGFAGTQVCVPLVSTLTDCERGAPTVNPRETFWIRKLGHGFNIESPVFSVRCQRRPRMHDQHPSMVGHLVSLAGRQRHPTLHRCHEYRGLLVGWKKVRVHRLSIDHRLPGRMEFLCRRMYVQWNQSTVVHR